jgi:hypothetical protein
MSRVGRDGKADAIAALALVRAMMTRLVEMQALEYGEATEIVGAAIAEIPRGRNAALDEARALLREYQKTFE